MPGALACGAVYVCARLPRVTVAPALTAAWLFGVSEQFWSQAIIAEVYTLNALLFFTVYALLLQGARQPERRWSLTEAESARLPLLRGRPAELTGDTTAAAAHYRRSHALYPHPDDEAGAALRRLGLSGARPAEDPPGSSRAAGG